MKDEKLILKDYKLLFSRNSTNPNCIEVTLLHNIGPKYLEIMTGEILINSENIHNNRLRTIASIMNKSGICLDNTLILSPSVEDLDLPEIENTPPFLQEIQQKIEAGHEIIKLQSFNSFIDTIVSNPNTLNSISLLPLDNVILIVKEDSNEQMLLEEKSMQTLNKRLSHNDIIEDLYSISLNK